MGKDTSMFAVTPLYEVKQIFLILMTITTIILASVAYAELKEITGDVLDIINNWKLVPFTEVYVAPEGQDCLSDEVEYNYKYGRFEGLDRGHCGCVSNSLNYLSSYPNCSEIYSSSGYCMTSNSRDAVDASTWRHQKMCFTRSGQSAASWVEGYVRRPYVDSAGNCESGYKKCGLGVDYENDKAICFPEDELCPITGITVEPSGTTPSGSGWEMANGTFSRANHQLWLRREAIGELPLVELSLTLTEYASSAVGPEDYDHIYNKRGPCYTGGAQDIRAVVTVSDTALAEHSVSKPSKCDRVDRRYTLFDKLRLDAFYLDQFEELSDCLPYNLTTLDDTDFDANTDADYLQSNRRCVGTACDRDVNFPTNCRGGTSSESNICNLVVHQNKCGQYVSAARDLSGDANSMGSYYRNEIAWNPDCEVDQDRLRSNVDPLNNALDAQLAVVVISTVIGVFVGFIWPIYMLTCGKSKFYGKPNEITVPERVDSILHFLKMGPLIASVVILNDIYKLYERAGKDNCSDSLTNESFDYLAEKLPEIYFTNIANICIEIVMLLAGMYFLYSKMREQMKVDVETTKEEDNDAGGEKPAAKINTVPVQPVTGGVQMQPAAQNYQPVQQQPVQFQQQQPVQFQQQPVQFQQQQPVQFQQQQPVQFQQQPVQFQQQPVQFQQQQPVQFQQQPVQYQQQPGMATVPTIGVSPVGTVPTLR